MCNHMAMAAGLRQRRAQNYDGPIPACVHLHGGEVPPELDGGPMPGSPATACQGHGYYTKDGAARQELRIYRYPNSQEARSSGSTTTPWAPPA